MAEVVDAGSPNAPASIVAVGNMNPAIYSPAWLRRYKILDEDEIAAAENENKKLLIILGAQLAQIPCRSIDLVCDMDRLVLTLKAEDKIDLLTQVASRIFAQLQHTPVRAIGINFKRLRAAQSAEGALRGLFAADVPRIDRCFPAGWDVGAKITSRATWPRLNLTLSRAGSRLLVDGNFHYEGEQLSSGAQVPDLIRERFSEDLTAFEKVTKELLPA
jgi:hypothetical protein